MSDVPSILFLLVGLILTGSLAALHWIHPFSNRDLGRLFRGRFPNFCFFSAGSFWFFTKIVRLGESDFGQYKIHLLVLFVVLYLLCLKYNYGFLGVRGLSIAGLIWSNEVLTNVLSSSYDTISILLKGYVYFVVVIALYLAAFPYRLRDFLWNRHENE